MIEAMKDFESKEAIAIARTESDTDDSTSGKAPSGPSLAICLFIFLLYAIAFTLAIPAFPILLLNVTGGRSDLSSFYYGSASCIKYLLEFFSSPFLGSLSDTYGRKKLLIFSLSVVCVELFMFAIYPSVGTLYLGSILSGLGNASNTIGHAIVTDISNNRREPAAKNFGYFGAVFGLGFIMGPLCGSLLVARNLQLCFVVAGSMAVLALIVTVVFFTESCLVFQSYDAAKSNPISSLRKFFANAGNVCMKTLHENVTTSSHVASTFVPLLYSE
jgi:DHA1 family tetracycline resistance protein-like MFS transporter